MFMFISKAVSLLLSRAGVPGRALEVKDSWEHLVLFFCLCVGSHD